jgi:hypothetical protein
VGNAAGVPHVRMTHDASPVAAKTNLQPTRGPLTHSHLINGLSTYSLHLIYQLNCITHT